MSADLLRIGPEDAVWSMILMHGLGADNSDLAPLAAELPAAKGFAFVLPNAPIRAVSWLGGAQARAWYDLRAAELVDGAPTAIAEEGIREAQSAVDSLVAGEIGRGVPADRIFLAGFSQGGALALFTGMRHRERLAGLVSLSGYLPMADTPAAELSSATKDLPVFLAHGTIDDVVPPELGRTARDAIGAAGCRVEHREYPIAHSICGAELRDLDAWLAKIVSDA